MSAKIQKVRFQDHASILSELETNQMTKHFSLDIREAVAMQFNSKSLSLAMVRAQMVNITKKQMLHYTDVNIIIATLFSKCVRIGQAT